MGKHDVDETGGQVADSAAFREAMSRLTQQVHIVTSTGKAGSTGITATTVISVSDTPPTILFCLNRASRRHAAFLANDAFCVNTLAGEHADLADIFAGRDDLDIRERFARASWARLATGAPVLEGALTVFDCRVMRIVDVATHSLVIGEVVAIGGDPTRSALVHRNRAYWDG